jgi:hypothetical protein
MAYAGDLKSPDAYASCGFDPHPGHQFGGVTANRSFSSAAPRRSSFSKFQHRNAAWRKQKEANREMEAKLVPADF